MIQKMKNFVTINVRSIDLYAVTDIEVQLQQGSTTMLYTGDEVQIGNEHQLLVEVPKSVAMGLDRTKYVEGQVMWTKDGIPDASDVFTVTVRRLLKEAGYGD